MPEKFIHSRVYVKPLIPAGRDPFEIEVEKVLKRTKRDMFRRIKSELQQEAFSDRAKKALAKAIKIEIKPNSLRITANHPAFRPLVEGQTTEQMKWLTKARRPIPIITESGKMIFRSATAKSMKDGKWVHPGRRPSTFIERAKKVSREHIKTKMRAEMKMQIKKALSRAGK